MRAEFQPLIADTRKYCSYRFDHQSEAGKDCKRTKETACTCKRMRNRSRRGKKTKKKDFDDRLTRLSEVASNIMEKEKDINEQIEKKAEEKIYEEKKHLKQEVKRYKEKVDKEQKKEKAYRKVREKS